MEGRIELVLTFEAPVLAVLPGEPPPDGLGRARFGGGGVGSLSLSEFVPGDDMVDDNYNEFGLGARETTGNPLASS